MIFLTRFTVVPQTLLLFGGFAPGIIFGLLLINIRSAGADWRNLVFIIVCGAIYFLCFWITTTYANSNSELSGSILAASCVGSLLLSCAYQLLLLNRLSFNLLLTTLLFVGVLSALPVVAVIYFEGESLSGFHEDNSELYRMLFFGSMFVIYPLWQTAFVFIISMGRFQFINDISDVEV